MSSKVNKLPRNDHTLLLLPQNKEETNFDGYIIVNNEEFRLQVNLASTDTLSGAIFHADWKIKELIAGYENVLLKRLHHSSTLASFLEEFKVLLENLLSFQETPCISLATTRSVLTEIAELGWENLVYTNEEFSVLKIRHNDNKGRPHVITVKIDEENRSSKVTCLTDLPVPFVPKLPNSAIALCLIHEQFGQMVEFFQPLWDNFHELDQACWVLEPENITYACTYRRIALGKNSSIYVQVDPARPREFPECRLLGADNIVEALKHKMNVNVELWDITKSLLSNLKVLLEMDFPSPKTVNEDEISINCGICYSYRLGEEFPDCVCDDPRCRQIFHNSCIVEWLRSLPTCRQSFNMIFGECPYCNKSLTIRLNKKT